MLSALVRKLELVITVLLKKTRIPNFLFIYLRKQTLCELQQ